MEFPATRPFFGSQVNGHLYIKELVGGAHPTAFLRFFPSHAGEGQGAGDCIFFPLPLIDARWPPSYPVHHNSWKHIL